MDHHCLNTHWYSQKVVEEIEIEDDHARIITVKVIMGDLQLDLSLLGDALMT